MPGVAAASVAQTVTALVYAPFAVPQLGEAADASGEALLSLLALGVVCTALALALFFSLIREVGPAGWLRVSAGTPEEMAAFKAALDEILSHPDHAAASARMS